MSMAAHQFNATHVLPRMVTVCTGGCEVSAENDVLLMTLLGSCIAVCVRDPVSGVGGMNHFLLPRSGDALDKHSESMRYGTYSMEQLLNRLYNKGAVKSRLELKVFGGANVIKQSAKIGERNVAFIREFIKAEGLHVAGADLGGDRGRRLIYHPLSGRVMLKRMANADEQRTVREEEQFATAITHKPAEGSIELFG
jgi:chemotaxis protein CheD